jgi:hypothetical protein
MPSPFAERLPFRRCQPLLIARLRRLVAFLGGGILLQSTGGCQEYLSSFIDALGQPVATGIGDGLSNLLQALVVGVFI